jgi:hypothetical protein
MNQSMSHGIQYIYQSSINVDHKAIIIENYKQHKSYHLIGYITV